MYDHYFRIEAVDNVPNIWFAIIEDLFADLSCPML
jgi:hypothetical protein